jgi:Protein of unknown function (DUF3455)
MSYRLGQQNKEPWRLRRVFVAALVLGCTFGTVTHAARKKIMSPRTPPIITPPVGNSVFLVGHATGVQIYVCKAKADDPSKFEWSFKAPEADLTNEKGKKIARHYAGPTWEASDGSKVIGEVQQKTDALKPGAVPWLLIKAKSNEGVGTFGKVTYIQRVDTVGGVAAAAGCDQAHTNTEVRVDYKANYYFYVRDPQ